MNHEQIFSMKRYDDFAHTIGAEILTIGHSEKGRPIKVLKKGSGKLKILFIARIHGNEPATTEAMLEFFNENNFSNIELYGIFLANPDGAALYEESFLKHPEPYWENNFNDARLNANGVDINRDWFDLSQKETQAIQKFIAKLQPDFLTDFHEYYWSDKGYPPKHPTDDQDGFMSTMTDSPFFGTDEYVKTMSEQAMNCLMSKLEKEYNWKIKPRHFVGEAHDQFENPIFLGIYIALRGIPKLLVETWGVACSTLLLDKRISFHKRAMKYLVDWIEENQSKFLPKQKSLTSLKFDLGNTDQNKIITLAQKLDLHGINYQLSKNNITVQCSPLEIGFIKTIYYIIFEKENKNL